VNLEGLKYASWPIARLISRELRDPTLPQFIGDATDPARAEILWKRDYWQVASRPPILEGNISPTPILLQRLTEQAWREALEQARDCLEQTKSGWKRAKQEVTLARSGQRVLGDVSPHLTLIYPDDGTLPWEDFFIEAKQMMQPYYDWVAERSA